MPRRYFKRRRRFRFRRRKGMSAYRKASLALSKINKLKSNVEYKKHDKTGSGTVYTAAPVIVPLSDIAQGDTDITRDGNQATAKSILLKLLISANSSQPAPTNVRWMLVLDRKNYTGSDPGIGDILESDSVVSQKKYDYRRRFILIADKIVTFSPDGKEGKVVKYYKKINIKMLFEGPNAADYTDNILYLVLVADVSISWPPSYIYNTRLIFTDS